MSYALPYISPKTVPVFAVVSLAVPFLFIINILFLIYWIIKLKKYFIISGMVLGLGLLCSSPFFKLTDKRNFLNNDLEVMSYNVRMFNLYNWIKDKTITDKILKLIEEKDPDILAMQEYQHNEKRKFNYNYSYIVPKTKNFGLAIYSKYPIINKGNLNFKNSGNNAIFADIVRDEDTIRVYNLHLQSLRINPSKENFGEKNSEKLFQRLKNGFTKQAEQAEQFLAHEKQWKGKKVICGDFNNTAYSWVYQEIAEDKKDAFLEAGFATGRTFNYIFPMRIDFILTDNTAEINRYDTYYKKYSDHFPIVTRVNWE